MDDKELITELSKITEPIVKDLREVHAKLEELEKAGAKPDADEVLRLQEKLDQLEERQRLAEMQVVGKEEEKKVDLDDAIFALAAREHPEFQKRVMEKRAIDSSVIASAGALNPEQANAFIDLVVSTNQIFQEVNTRRMNANTALLEQILISRRKLRLAQENTAPALADSVSTQKRSLSTKEVIWADDITLTFLEDNIERRGAYNHIVSLIATAFGNDLADLAWNGDESLAATITDNNSDNLDDTTGLSQNDHTFLRVNNGWLAIANAEVTAYDAASATKPSEVFKAMRNLLSEQFKVLGPTFYVAPDIAEAYGDELATRTTALGDRVTLNGNTGLRWFGYRIYADPNLAKNGDIAQKILFTLPRNLTFGIQRTISLDAEWVPRRRAFEITVSARNDYEFAVIDPVVLATNVPTF